MNFNIQAKGFDLTQTIREYFENQVQKLGKIIDIDDSSVIFFAEIAKTNGDNKGKDLYRAELMLEISGKQFFSKEELSDIYPAIDKVCDEIFLMMRDYKDRKKDDRRKYGSRIKRMLKRVGFDY